MPADPVEHRLESVYYDTTDLPLVRRGVTVRRSADGWSVDRRAAGAEEVVLAARGSSTGELPVEIGVVTVGWALGESLGPVARVATVRRAIVLRDTERALAAAAGEHAWTAGVLAGRESVRAAERRAALPYALTRATRRKLWTLVP